MIPKEAQRVSLNRPVQVVDTRVTLEPLVEQVEKLPTTCSQARQSRSVSPGLVLK